MVLGRDLVARMSLAIYITMQHPHPPFFLPLPLPNSSFSSHSGSLGVVFCATGCVELRCTCGGEVMVGVIR